MGNRKNKLRRKPIIMEFLIGREVTGSNTIKVPHDFLTVSRVHAKIVIDEHGMVIVDLNSTTGTFVNEERCQQKMISFEDNIVVGSPNGFKIDIQSCINLYNETINLNKINYSHEFDDLELLYKEYHYKKSRIEEKPKKVIAFLVLFIICLNFYLHLIKNDYATYTMGISALIGSLSVFFIPKDKIKNKLSDLKLQYRAKYVCPKCRHKLNLEIPWKELKADKLCPNKCGAKYSE